MTKPEGGILPGWLERWIVTGLIGVLMILTDRRISKIEKWQEEKDKIDDAFAIQYIEDRSTLLEAQRQILMDIRTLCGNRNKNYPCGAN